MKISKISRFQSMPIFKRSVVKNTTLECGCGPKKVNFNLERTPSKDIFKKA